MRWPARVPPYWLGMIIAVLLILIGIVGLVLPFLQGLLFIFLGLLLIMEYHYIPFFERRREWMRKQYERLKGWRRRR